MKKVIWTVILSVFAFCLFIACKNYTTNIEDYLSYWSTEASIADYTFVPEPQTDAEGVCWLTSKEPVTVTFTLRNPKNFDFKMPGDSGAPADIITFPQTQNTSGKKAATIPQFGKDYEFKKISNTKLALTYTPAFLRKYEWGSETITPAITLYTIDGRAFKQTAQFQLKVNTPPPAIKKCVIAQTKTASSSETSYYVLCLQLSDDDMKEPCGNGLLHEDIAGIEIAGIPYSLSIDSVQKQLNVQNDSPFIDKDKVTQLTPSPSEAIPSDWTLYFKTDVKVMPGSAKKEYTIRLKDAKGLYSKSVTAMTQLNEPQQAQAAVITGTKIYPLSGDGTTQELAIVIKAAALAPEAQIKLSVPDKDVTIHYTLTEVGHTSGAEQTGTSPVTVDIPLNGAGEKVYKVAYHTDGVAFKPSAPKTVYYKVLKEHTVTFDSKGGSGVPAQKILYGSQILSIPAAPTAPSGYTFRNWCKDDACTTAWDFASGTVTSDITLYAKWDPVGGVSYTVQHFQQNINDDDYTIVSGATQTLSGTTGQLTTATANGYAGFEPLPIEQKTITGDGSTVIEIKYKRKRITVTFKLDGGKIGSSTDDVSKEGKFDTPFAAPVPEKQGYAFTGWLPTLDPSPKFPAADTTYTVQWTANQYKVHFNGNGSTGGSMSDQTFTYGKSQALQSNGFERTGYTFMGWAYSSDATTSTYTDGKSVGNLTITNNAVVQLYAVWHINTYTVTFKVDGAQGGSLKGTYNGTPKTVSGSAKQQFESVPYNSTITFTATPDSDYEVDSWTGATVEVGNNENASLTVRDNVTVTVKFEQQAAPVTTWEALRIAVQNAPDGAVIEVANNITYEFTGANSIIAVSKDVTIKSKGSDTYTLNAGGGGADDPTPNAKSSGIFEVDSGKTLTLENLILTRTEKYTVYVGHNSSLKMKDVTIKDCKTQDNAAGVYFNKGNDLTLENCKIEKCKGNDSSGGINIQEPTGTVIIKDTEIKNCETKEGGNGAGGGVYLYKVTGTLENVTVNSCTAKSGGGIYVKDGALTVTGGSFINNSAGGIGQSDGGGAIYNEGSKVTITGCTIGGKGSDSSNRAARGGGIFVSGAAAECILSTGTKISGNSATRFSPDKGNGGGVYIENGSCTMNNVLVTECTADVGGAVYVNEGTFSISGGTRIAPSSDGEEQISGKNDVYLKSGKVITVTGNLTAQNPIARITPENYPAGSATVTVLEGAAVTTDYTKFTVTDQAGTPSKKWKINASGNLEAVGGQSQVVTTWEALRTAVQGASDGAVIEIANDLMYDISDAADKESIIKVTKDITIKSTASHTYTLDAGGRGADNTASNAKSTGIFEVENGKTLTLESVTLTKTERYAVYVDHNSSLTMKDVTITDCKTQYSVAGVYFNKGKDLTLLENCKIEKCKGKGDGSSGGIDIQAPTGTVSIKDTEIENCEAEANGGGINLYNGNNVQCKLENVRVKNCSALRGGGLHVKAGTLTISGGSFTSNLASGVIANGGGGAIYSEGAEITITGCTIGDDDANKGNLALQGGGVYVAGNSSLKMENVTIKNCVATGEYSAGGGVYLYKGTCSLEKVSVEECKAPKGGGIFVREKSECILNQDVKIRENEATGTNSNGGGIFVSKNADSTQFGTLTIEGTSDNPVTISKNKAEYGGGLYNFGTVTIKNAKIEKNEVPHHGGGMVNAGTCTMDSVKLENNKAGSEGGGIYSSKVLTLKDTTVTGNEATMSGGAIQIATADSVFNMSGSTVITVEPSGGLGTPSKNDVYVTNNAFITLTGELTATGKIARITLNSSGGYQNDREIVKANSDFTIPSGYENKFTMTDKIGSPYHWKLILQKNALKLKLK